jgi:pimeloyl-ACP methyl ester carboxylesterase
VPEINLRWIARRIPHARLAVFPGAHAFLFQSRHAFARALDEFLRLNP